MEGRGQTGSDGGMAKAAGRPDSSGTRLCPGVAKPTFWSEQISRGPEGCLQDPLAGWAPTGQGRECRLAPLPGGLQAAASCPGQKDVLTQSEETAHPTSKGGLGGSHAQASWEP